jgi:hypothetical protein
MQWSFRVLECLYRLSIHLVSLYWAISCRWKYGCVAGLIGMLDRQSCTWKYQFEICMYINMNVWMDEYYLLCPPYCSMYGWWVKPVGWKLYMYFDMDRWIDELVLLLLYRWTSLCLKLGQRGFYRSFKIDVCERIKWRNYW